MTNRIYKIDYRQRLIENSKMKNLDFVKELKKLQQLLYYEESSRILKEWSYHFTTAFLSEKELENASPEDLKRPLYVNFLSDKKTTTRFFSIKINEWNNVIKFVDDFHIKPEQVVLASWIYPQKAVILTFYADRSLTEKWFSTLERTLQYFNTYGIEIYGELHAKASVSIPSHVCDRHLDPNNGFQVTDELSLVLNQAKNALEHPISISDFQKEFVSKYEVVEKIINSAKKHEESIDLTDEECSTVKKIANFCKDPQSIYGEKFQRKEWSSAIYQILLEIYSKIKKAKSLASEDALEVKVSLTLQELYLMRRKYSFYKIINTKALRELLMNCLVENNEITSWNSNSQEMTILLNEDQNLESLIF